MVIVCVVFRFVVPLALTIASVSVILMFPMPIASAPVPSMKFFNSSVYLPSSCLFTDMLASWLGDALPLMSTISLPLKSVAVAAADMQAAVNKVNNFLIMFLSFCFVNEYKYSCFSSYFNLYVSPRVPNMG